MGDVEEVRIDVRDLDYTWFEGIRAYLDRRTGCYHLPRESVDRLGEVDQGTGLALLIDGHVEALPASLHLDGSIIPAWTVRDGDLIIRRPEDTDDPS